MDLGLSDRVYVVTGGTRGLGFATAQALVADGARVVVSSRSPDSVAAAAGRLGDGARGVAADNADAGSAELLTRTAIETWGRLDGALISVGGPPATSALGADEDQWRNAFESVFLGAVRVARAVVPHLGDGGALAFVLSTSAKSPLPGLEISNGLRPGLAVWMKMLADEVGPRGVRVVSLLPGRVLTDRLAELAPDEESRARMAEAIPLRRLGSADEFGRVAAFLLSPAASYVSGVALAVDGGALRTL